MTQDKKIYRLLRLLTISYWRNRREWKKIRKKEKAWNKFGCRPIQIKSD